MTIMTMRSILCVLISLAFALRVAQGSGLPDLGFGDQEQKGRAEAQTSLSDQGFGGLTPIPVAGDLVTIAVTVSNFGDVQASGIELAFFEGDPQAGGTPIGPAVLIRSLAPLESARVTRVWDTIGRAGTNLLSVVIDPRNKIAERTKENNRFSFVRTVALLGDFNQDGRIDPLDRSILSYSLGSRVGEATWNPLADIWTTELPLSDPQSIRATRDGIVDQWDLALFSSTMDLNLTAKAASLSYDHTDHVVFLRGSSETVFSRGDGFLVGEVLSLAVRFPTVGDADVGHIGVAFFDGDPGEGGREIGHSTISEAFGGIGAAAVRWPTVDIASGWHTLFAVADPTDQKEESVEDNNRISVAILLDTPTGLDDSSSVPGIHRKPVLSQNTPNPFNTSTIIPLNLPEPGHIRVEILDVTGRRIGRLFDGDVAAGTQLLTWKGADEAGRTVPSGVYICRLIVNSYSPQARKLLLLR